MATNREFLEQKMKNYLQYLRDNSRSPALVDEIGIYGVDVFLAFASTNLVPLKKENKLETAVEKTIEHFQINDTVEIRAKLTRYYEFLVDFVKSVGN
jgi:hypothetical protein